MDRRIADASSGEAADQFEAAILWTAAEPMLHGRPYVMKITSQNVQTTITRLKYKYGTGSGEHLAASVLAKNEIAVCNISLDRQVSIGNRASNRQAAVFTLNDRLTNATLGIGLIRFALYRSANISWQAVDIDRNFRAAMKHQKPAVLWFTGLSGAGKSTIANIVEKKLAAAGRHTFLLDGDNVRHGLNRDLGFTEADRVENIRRVAEVASLMADAGLVVLVSLISPFRSERRMAREMLPQGEFVEIHVDTTIEVAEARDVKGLYAKARAGLIRNFTGIDSPYEPPENPEIRIDTVSDTAQEAAELVLRYLDKAGIARAPK